MFLFLSPNTGEPEFDGLVEAEVVHEVERRHAEAATHLLDVVVELVAALGVGEGLPINLVVAEGVRLGGFSGRELLRADAGAAVAGHGIAMPEGALHDALVEHPADVLQGVESLLQRLRGEAVHEVGVHHDAAVAEMAAYGHGLADGDALVHEPQQPVGSHLQAAAHCHAARVAHEVAHLGGVGLLETYVAPEADHEMAAQDFLADLPQQLGRQSLIDEMEAADARLCHNSLHAVHNRGGVGCLVAGDVVEARVAEGATVPVAAVSHHHLVPAPLAPEAVHGVGHLGQRDVLLQGQPVEIGGGELGIGDVLIGVVEREVSSIESADKAVCGEAAFEELGEAQQGQLAVVEGDIVAIVEDAFVREVAPLRVGEAPAEDDSHLGTVLLEPAAAAQGAIETAREGYGKAHGVGLLLLDMLLQEAEHLVVDTGCGSL